MLKLVVLAVFITKVLCGGPHHDANQETFLPLPKCPLCSDVKAGIVDLFESSYLDYSNKNYQCDPGNQEVLFYNNEIISKIKGICAGNYFG
ncbi:hypothetical protein PVAND_000895 [Polypedilum vanderplanki]|uniref:Uncharacterized protein n=1 Tax=Polypedilum vanderplanki TaxID=319348 RepID=A0A9J6BLX4_POLVA|nr:hypothetical protein PVAND_000895 [Polypedilum vanderplanki]